MDGKRAEKYIPVKVIGFKDCRYHFSYENEIYPYDEIVKKEVNGYIQKNLGDNTSGFICKPCKFSLAFIPKNSEYKLLEDRNFVSNEIIVFKNLWTYFLHLVLSVL